MTELYNILTTTYNKRFNYFKKKNFRKIMKERYENQGYTVQEDNGLIANNLYIGNLNADKVLMAHYDTPPNMSLFLIFNNAFGAKLGQVLIILVLIISLYFVGSTFPQYYGIYNIILSLYIISMFVVGNNNNFTDNTSGVLTILAFLETKEVDVKRLNEEYLIVLTDNEEKGLFGAYKFKRFMKKQKQFSNKNIVVIDCVGAGENYAVISLGKNANADKFYKVNNQVSGIERYPSKVLMSDNGMLGQNAFLVSKLSKSKYFKKPTIKHMHTNKDKELNINNIVEVHQMIKNYFEN
ncbi:MAG: M28 family peptidase [Mycoplasmatales bacterium]